MTELSVLEAPRKRRRYSPEFKTRIINACQQTGASVAGIALENALNANLVHKWIREARRQTSRNDPPAFVPVPISGTSAPESTQHNSEVDYIRLSIPRAKGVVIVEWPVSDQQGCQALLKDLLS